MMCVGSRSFSPRIELLVEFVDGVTRLELMKKADELMVVANTTYPNTFEMLVTVVVSMLVVCCC